MLVWSIIKSEVKLKMFCQEMKFCIKQKCCDVKQISQWKTIPKQLTIFTMVMRSWPTKGLLIQEKIKFCLRNRITWCILCILILSKTHFLSKAQCWHCEKKNSPTKNPHIHCETVEITLIYIHSRLTYPRVCLCKLDIY